MITALKSKLHRATATDANLDYVGSITIDEQLMDRAGLQEWEKVLVVNINNNARYETYVLRGRYGSREIVINGAAARSVLPGDRLIIMAWRTVPEDYPVPDPDIITLDENNHVIDV